MSGPIASAAASSGSAEEKAIKYPGEVRSLSWEEVGFLRQTFWLLVAMTVGVTLFLGLAIHVVSTRRRSSS